MEGGTKSGRWGVGGGGWRIKVYRGSYFELLSKLHTRLAAVSNSNLERGTQGGRWYKQTELFDSQCRE